MLQLPFLQDVMKDLRWQPLKAGGVYLAFISHSMSADSVGHFFFFSHIRPGKGSCWWGLILDSKCKNSVRSVKQSPCLPQQRYKWSPHEDKFCHQAFSFPGDRLPFSSKLFDQFDSFKQNTTRCVFQANFALHRWPASVYFSFIFNGRPFRHCTQELPSSCTSSCLSSRSPPLRLFPRYWG